MGGASSKGDNGGDNKTKFGYTKPKSTLQKVGDFITGGGITGAILKGLDGEKVNRNFFDTKVKKAGKSKYDNYEDYIKARGRGEVDAYGREVTNTGGGNDNNQTVLNTEATQQVVSNNTTAPTNAEITQAQSTNMSGDEILVANKKKGRSQTILNTSQGLGGSTANTMKKTLGA